MSIIDQIDWNSIWRTGATFMIGEADKAEGWDKNAANWNETQTQSDFGDKIMERLKLEPDWTALDIGAGTGLLSLPMAKKCRYVTALDASSEMLRYLKQNAEQQGLSNIAYVHKLIENTTIGEDVPKHDIVVACRSMGLEQNVRTFLKKMDEAAKRYAYIIWGAQERTFDIAIYNAMGRPYGETREYIILYNLLYQMGIRANIDIFTCKQKSMSYSSIDEALSRLSGRFKRMKMGREITPTEEEKLKKFFEENLTKTDDGTLTYDQGSMSRHALIWWDKKIQ